MTENSSLFAHPLAEIVYLKEVKKEGGGRQ
jgi:hypothetical protein